MRGQLQRLGAANANLWGDPTRIRPVVAALVVGCEQADPHSQCARAAATRLRNSPINRAVFPASFFDNCTR